jgi:urea ABC transporter ATP-binding protein UrtE
VLRLANVSSGYGETQVLRNLSLNVAEREMVAILGRNGVGKSTMLRTAMGAVPVGSGTVEFRGENLTHLPTFQRSRRGIAYVPQGRDIFPSLSVQENLLVAAYGTNRKDEMQQLEEIYQSFPVLAEKRWDRGSSLSGGQQQILALARALMISPHLLLLDEPSEGIQPSIIDQIAETVCAMNVQRGIAVVLVEQNLDFAASIVPRACIMDRGQIVTDLPTREVAESKDIQREFLGL